MNFYLDYDTRQKCYYLAPFKVRKDELYLIRFSTRHEADKYLKMLNSAQLKNPLLSSGDYELIEELLDGDSRVKVYGVKKRPV